jgi:dephospho-CoA kinase
MTAPTLRLGLTGGIGSGKSTVASFLSRLGAAVIDADAISRSTTAPDGAAIDTIRKEFGAQFINSAGALDRDAMRSLAFADIDARKRLEAIIHPLVGHETRRQASEAEASGKTCIAFDIPLLVESAYWRQEVDKVLVVDCTPDIQIERVLSRSALTHEAVKKIIASQSSRETRLRAADYVIYNAGISLDQLATEVGKIPLCFGL